MFDIACDLKARSNLVLSVVNEGKFLSFNQLLTFHKSFLIDRSSQM